MSQQQAADDAAELAAEEAVWARALADAENAFLAVQQQERSCNDEHMVSAHHICNPLAYQTYQKTAFARFSRHPVPYSR